MRLKIRPFERVFDGTGGASDQEGRPARRLYVCSRTWGERLHHSDCRSRFRPVEALRAHRAVSD